MTDRFGPEDRFKLEAFVQYRDVIDKGIELSVGDFFSYGENFYEIMQLVELKPIYGLVEYKDGIKIVATKARFTSFNDANINGPTDVKYSDADAVQSEFVQQRGFAENKLGSTGDTRALYVSGVLDRPTTGPREVSSRGSTVSGDSSFYDE